MNFHMACRKIIFFCSHLPTAVALLFIYAKSGAYKLYKWTGWLAGCVIFIYYLCCENVVVEKWHFRKFSAWYTSPTHTHTRTHTSHHTNKISSHSDKRIEQKRNSQKAIAVFLLGKLSFIRWRLLAYHTTVPYNSHSHAHAHRPSS